MQPLTKNVIDEYSHRGKIQFSENLRAEGMGACVTESGRSDG